MWNITEQLQGGNMNKAVKIKCDIVLDDYLSLEIIHPDFGGINKSLVITITQDNNRSRIILTSEAITTLIKELKLMQADLFLLDRKEKS